MTSISTHFSYCKFFFIFLKVLLSLETPLCIYVLALRIALPRVFTLPVVLLYLTRKIPISRTVVVLFLTSSCYFCCPSGSSLTTPDLILSFVIVFQHLSISSRFDCSCVYPPNKPLHNSYFSSIYFSLTSFRFIPDNFIHNKYKINP